MSIRGVIARPIEGGWEGRYHHFDSYPTGLGKALFDAYHATFEPDVAFMQKVLIDEHPAGWSNIIGADWSLDPGYVNYGGRSADDAHRPQCYCHGDRSEPEMKLHREIDGVCGPDCDPMFTEWVYVLRDYGMTVLYSTSEGGEYHHAFAAEVDWNDEPIWARIEGKRYA